MKTITAGPRGGTARRWAQASRLGIHSPITLIILAGLPGTGKTTLARALARDVAAVYVRIDSIDQALRNAGHAVEGDGYGVAYAVAEDNLRLGRTVVADSVNPWALTRHEWRAVAERAGVPAIEVEITCSDAGESAGVEGILYRTIGGFIGRAAGRITFTHSSDTTVTCEAVSVMIGPTR